MAELDVTRSTPDFKDVLRVLLDKAAKWYSIGLHLELNPGELDTIKADCTGVEECLTRVIRKWHSNADPPPTWRAVIDALKARAVSESVLARQLEEKYIPKASTEIIPDVECKASIEVARQSLTNIKQSFAALLKNVAVKLKSKQELDLEVFRFFVVNLFPPGNCIHDSSSVITIFEAISMKGLWSYWHYAPVEKIVKEYAPEDDEAKGWLVNYKKELGGYKATTRIADAIELYGSDIEEFEDCNRSQPVATSYDPAYLRRLSVKLNTPVTGKTLEYVDDLWLSLAEYFLLPALSALLDNIKRGCVEVSWLIPPRFMFHIVGNLQKNTDFLKTKDIVKVFIEGDCVYNGTHLDEVKKISKLKQQNVLLSQTMALLQEKVNTLQSKVKNLAGLAVQVESLEKENEEESILIQELLQQNAYLKLDSDNKNAELESLNSEIAQLKLKLASKPDPSAMPPVHKPTTKQDIDSQTKLLRLERENRELEQSLQVAKQSSDQVSVEMDKMSRRLTARIHADMKEISRLKEELRREQSQHHVGITRRCSVSEDKDQQGTMQLQEPESKSYPQSFSNNDKQIQVLEKRVEAMTMDNSRLRVTVEKLSGKLKEASQMNRENLTENPSMKRVDSSRELSQLREQAADAVKLREKLHRVQEDNSHLASDLLEAKDILQKHETTNHRLHDRIQMLEQLNQTLEEEKKTLLGQLNKLLEQNQNILVKTLESKDQALEDERIFNDRLGELERDKARLTGHLVAQQREHLAREIDYYKKSKKKGFKKLKGKIQGRSTSSPHILSAGSPGSVTTLPAMGTPLYGYDGSMSSSQSISSSKSEKQSEDIEDMEQLDGGAGASVPVPCHPIAEGSPFLRPKKSRSYTLPGLGQVKLRHGPAQVASPRLEADRSDCLMSLEDFLAEAQKTSNRRKAMELHRHSLIQHTPPSTPRNSMLLVPTQAASSSSSQIFNLQEFLTRFEPEDSPTMHREMDEAELHQHARSRLRSSQESVPQASNDSKSSSGLRSAPSSTSITQENTDHDIPVTANPAMLPSTPNNNSNNNNNSGNGSHESDPAVGTTNYNMTTGSVTVVEGNGEMGTGNKVGSNLSTPNYPKAVGISQTSEANSVFLCSDASSRGSRSLSSSMCSTNDICFGQGAGLQNQLFPAVAVPEVSSGNASRPPLVQQKFDKSSFDLAEPKRQQQPKTKKRVDFSEAETASLDVISLSRMTDQCHKEEVTNMQQLLPLGAQQRSKRTKNSKKHNSLQVKPIISSKSQEHLQGDHTLNNASDEH